MRWFLVGFPVQQTFSTSAHIDDADDDAHDGDDGFRDDDDDDDDDHGSSFLSVFWT